MSTPRPSRAAASRPRPRRRAARLLSGVSALAAAALAVGVLAAGHRRSSPAGGSAGATAPDTLDAPARRDAAVHVRRAIDDSEVRHGGAAGAACEVPIVRRDTLRDAQGRPFFLAPDAMISRDGELLIAGQHSVRFVHDASGALVDIEQDAVLAALRDRTGRVRTFGRPSAIGDLRLTPVRAVALPQQRWALLLTHRPDGLVAPTSSRAWLAVLGANGWESVQPLLPPPGVRILDGATAALDVRGERLLAALPAIRDDDPYGALLLEGTASAPTLRFVPLIGVSYAAAVFAHDTEEPALFAVHTELMPRKSGNTLHLYRPNRQATPPIQLSDGVQYAVHQPSVVAVPGGFRVTARRQSRADRSAPQEAVHLHIPDDGAITTTVLGTAEATIAQAHTEAAQVYAAYLSQADSTALALALHAFPGPGRGMRVAVNTARPEVLGLATDGASTLIVATLHDGALQATSVSLALTWVTPRCPSTTGAEDAR